jgi:AraC family transcriptional regulator, transcriptional activator FtrA
VIANLSERIHEPLTIASMASAAAMSERTFLRRFREATGRSPAEWLIDARLERARELLESTALNIDAIAQRCGFGASATLRHHFRRKVALSPLAYRARFTQPLDTPRR